MHRAQGSEFPAVVVVLPAEAGGMLSRPLVYTALTRAQRHLSIVHAAGPRLAHAVRQVGARPRRTWLGRALRDMSYAAGIPRASPRARGDQGEQGLNEAYDSGGELPNPIGSTRRCASAPDVS